MKGYLTVFLSLSLTIFLSVFLGLIGGALQNFGKMRFECASDISMNSLLGEFHRELLEQYDLLFVDISYGNGYGQIANVEEHLKDYMEKNIHTPNQKTAAWNDLALIQVTLPEYRMASDYEGMVMQRQAGAYMRESGREDAFEDLRDSITVAGGLGDRDGMELWSGVMNQISEIGLPMVINRDGQWEEVPLDNPADKVFGAAGEQLESVCQAGAGSGRDMVIPVENYLSHRSRNMGKGSWPTGGGESDRYLFQTYLFEKCGHYQKKKPNSLLEYQIEYIIFGEDSDGKNRTAAVEKIFKLRFSDQIGLYFNNESKYGEAKEIAEALYAVELKPELLELVTHSILYAWAFIDSIYDTGIIMDGGQVPLIKEEIDFTGEGLDYLQYLWLIMSCEDEANVNLRTMDIMEMDIRQTAYNQHFRMDWCLESYRVQAKAADQMGAAYEIDRKYGYY